ncbi:hypothetical protein L3V83_03300 [Thiotrichales bacterium 19X7-9]|nr:hypothetical protein [Thiotrichales bacterium 19X7-9]
MKMTSVVVLYKHPLEMLEKFLASYEQSIKQLLSKYSDMQSCLYIVNNDAEKQIDYQFDTIKQKYSVDVIFLGSDKNGGYGYGNNFVMDRLDSEYHLVVNPDIVFEENTLTEALSFLETHHEVGLLTPAVFDVDGNQQFLCKKNPTLLIQFLRFVFKQKKVIFKKYLENYEYAGYSYDEIIYDIPNCTGCFMLFRTALFKQLEGFDERFFYYMEDSDISRRALEIAKTAYVPSVKVSHEYQGDAYKNKKLRNQAIKSALKYWRKWGGLI